MTYAELQNTDKWKLQQTFTDNSGDLIEHYISSDLRTSVQISKHHNKFRIAESTELNYSDPQGLE